MKEDVTESQLIPSPVVEPPWYMAWSDSEVGAVPSSFAPCLDA